MGTFQRFTLFVLGSSAGNDPIPNWADIDSTQSTDKSKLDDDSKDNTVTKRTTDITTFLPKIISKGSYVTITVRSEESHIAPTKEDKSDVLQRSGVKTTCAGPASPTRTSTFTPNAAHVPVVTVGHASTTHMSHDGQSRTTAEGASHLSLVDRETPLAVNTPDSPGAKTSHDTAVGERGPQGSHRIDEYCRLRDATIRAGAPNDFLRSTFRKRSRKQNSTATQLLLSLGATRSTSSKIPHCACSHEDYVMIPKSLLATPLVVAPQRFPSVMLSPNNVALLISIGLLSLISTYWVWKCATRKRCSCRLCDGTYVDTGAIIGSGGYGTVHLVREGKRKLVAKHIPMDEITLLDECQREAKELLNLRHKHIVSHVDDFTHVEFRLGFHSNRSLFGAFAPRSFSILILEYCPHGDLKKQIEMHYDKFTEGRVGTWFAELLSAVQYCHKKNIVHRDIKSQNVFITKDGSLRLGDFGLCRRQRNDGPRKSLLSHAGTDCYMAPEVLACAQAGKAADMWGIGCVLFELLTRKFLWKLNGVLGVMVLVDKHAIDNLLKQDNVAVKAPHLIKTVRTLLNPSHTARPRVEELAKKKLFKSSKLQKIPFHECSSPHFSLDKENNVMRASFRAQRRKRSDETDKSDRYGAPPYC